MANSVKLLNYVEIEGTYLRFYTELDSSVEVGDKVFIVGGSYDNTVYTTPEHPSYDPYNEYAMGYTVLSVDGTTNSNAITLNIRYNFSAFTSGGIQSLIIKPTSVYASDADLITAPNQLREAYLTTAYFRRGDFNGGTFDGGVMGEFNRRGFSTSVDKPYQRQYAVDALIAKLTLEGKLVEAAVLRDTDYSVYETQVDEYTTTFNNKPENNVATFANGIIAGAKWQWGSWKTKFSNKKTGKKQTYNDFGLNTTVFTDNNGGKGYSSFISGSIGEIYHNVNHMHTVTVGLVVGGATITLDFVPYELKQAFAKGFNTFVKLIDSNINTFVYPVTAINGTVLSVSNLYTTTSGKTETISLFPETGSFSFGAYVSDSVAKPNRLQQGTFTNADWFGGVAEKAFVQGGNWYNGEALNSSVGSIYERLNWYGGHSENTLAENVRWFNGTWFSGQWRGDSVVTMLSYTISPENNTLLVVIPTSYAHLFVAGEQAFISYIKKSLNNEYINNYTDLPNNNLLNFQEFLITEIVQSESIHAQTTLVLSGEVDSFANVNLVYAKISQSFFKKGVWVDGVWESGIRSVASARVDNVPSTTVTARAISRGLVANTSLINNNLALLGNVLSITLTGDEAINFTSYRMGDRCTVSNVVAIFTINGLLLEELSYTNKTYKKPIHEMGTIVGLIAATKTIDVLLPASATILEAELNVTYQLTGVGLVDDEYPLTLFSTAVWLNGDFRSGVWKGGIWNDGLFRSKLYFDLNNTQPQSVWSSGYWKKGTLNGGAFLSGVWENGVVKDGVFSNFYHNKETNKNGVWNEGDTFWLDGIFENGKWRGGVWKKGYMLDGTILNGGIENIVWQKGVYDNGDGLYDSAVNSNRSGIYKADRNSYDNLSAPSLVYVDGNGWVQLDQPSLYQQGYNVILQDLNAIKNPFNNQMFTVRNRNQFGSRIQIDYASAANSDNPLFATPVFANHKPLVAADNIADMCELFKDDTSHIVWFTDKGHQRIIAVDLIKNTVDALGIIINDVRSEIYAFTNLSKITTTNGVYVYVLDNNQIKRISKAKNTTDLTRPERDIDTLVVPVTRTETLIDLWAKPASDSSPETIFALSDSGSLYTRSNDSLTFTVTSLPVVMTSDYTTAITYCKAIGSNTVHAFLYNKLNSAELHHLVLEYNLSDKSYSLPANGLYDLTASLGGVTEPVVSLASSFDDGQNQIRVWLATDNTVNIVTYRSFFTGSNNDTQLLNTHNTLDYPLNTVKIGFDKSYLLLIGKDGDNYPSVIATAKVGKFTSGFASKNSALSLLNIYQDLQEQENRRYYYYDIAKNPLIKRLIQVTPTLPNQYSPEYDVDVLSTDEEALKMINGGNDGEIFTIVRNTRLDVYFVRHTIFGAEGSTTDYRINATNVVIADVSYCRNNVFVVYSCTVSAKNVTRIAAFNELTPSREVKVLEPNLTKYAETDLGITGSTGAMYLDVIENRDTFIGILYKASRGFYQLVIDNTTVTTKKLYDAFERPVRDITLAANSTGFSLFTAFDTQVIKTVTDTTFSENNVTFFKWTDLLDIRGIDQKVDNDSVFEGKAVSEIYRSTDSRRLVIRNGYRFSVVNTGYDDNKVNLNVSEFVAVSATEGYALSNQTLMRVKGTTSEFNQIQEIGFGNYKQRNRLSVVDVADQTTSLNEPFALTYVPSFNDIGHNYLFFIDNTAEIDPLTRAYKKCIRYYNINNGEIGVARPTDSLAGMVIRDLSYVAATKEIYAIYDVYSFGIVSSSLFKFKWSGGEIYDVTAIGSLVKGYGRFSLFSLSNVLHAVAVTSNGRQVDLIQDVAGASATVANRTRTITNSVKIKDVAASLNTDGTLHIYYLSNKLVYFNQAVTGEVFADTSWLTSFKALNEYDGVLSITESSLALNGNTRGIYINNNGSHIAKAVGGQNSGQSFTITDITYSPVSDAYVYLYNASGTSGAGLLRQQYTKDSPVLDLRSSNMIADQQNVGGYKKTVAVSDSTAYVLFDSGLYKYNFNSKRVSVVTLDNVRMEYRNALEAIPSNTALYHYKVVDIAYYTYAPTPITSKTDLVVVVEIFNGDQSTGCFDMFLYNGSAFSKEQVNYLYGGLTNRDAIQNNGASDLTRLSADLGSGKGGLLHLFKSSTPPTVFTLDGAFYLEFSTSNTRKLTKVSADYTNHEFFPTASSIELVYRVNKHGRDFNLTELKTICLLKDGKTIAYNAAIITDTYMVDGVDILLGNPNAFVVSFVRNTNTLIQEATDYNMKVHFVKQGDATSQNFIVDQADAIDSQSIVTPVYNVVYKNNTVQLPGTSAPLSLVATTPGTYYVLTNNQLVPNKTTANSPVYNISTPVIITKDADWSVAVFGTENHEHIIQDYELLPFLNKYSFDTLLNGYRVTNPAISEGVTTQVLSPYVTSRVLVDTHINKDVLFNKKGSAYTAHLVSAVWKNNDFIGSWDAPYYRNNLVIEKSSYFISGTFSGIFHDGYFLGGKFKNPDNSPIPSTVLQGHFISESEDINFVSGQVDSPYRYDINTVFHTYDAQINKDYLTLDTLAYKLTPAGYVPSISDTLTKGRAVNIPVLFQEKQLDILEVLRPDKAIYPVSIVLLKVDNATFKNLDITPGNRIFIRCNEYTEYLFGFKQVVDTYASGSFAYIAIESEFSHFTNGTYKPFGKPVITLNQYQTIAKNTLVVQPDGTFINRLFVEVAVPDTYQLLQDKLRYIQRVYLNDGVQMMYSGDFSGKVSIPDYLQVFTLSFTKGFYDSVIDITSPLEHVYLRDVTSADYTSRVSINLGTADASAFALGIMVDNSYVTTPTTRLKDWMERSTVLSGKTDRNWKNGAWLNLDKRGFNNAVSSFGDDSHSRTFEGEYTNIVAVFFETDQALWIQLSEPLNTLRVNDYMLLRGFTGNKSLVIGAERSQAFKVLKIDGDFVKIRNPFAYFSGIGSGNPYFKDFNKDFLQVRKQTMLVKDVSGTPDVNSANTEHEFNYGMASVSCFNGGSFDGVFSSVWNAGTFTGGEFKGEWFGSHDGANWSGNVSVTSVPAINGFALEMMLTGDTPATTAALSENDLVYVTFQPLVVSKKLRPVADGFYAVVQNVNNKLKINKFTTSAIRSGSYPVTIIRYRTGYSSATQTLSNYLITDYNSNNSNIVTAADHTLMPYFLSVNENEVQSTENKALIFSGDNGISISDALYSAKTSGNPSQFSFDLWFTVDDALSASDDEQIKPLISFQRSDSDALPGTKLYIQKQALTLEYQDLVTDAATEVVLFDTVVTSRWYHLGVFYSNGQIRATLYDQDYTNSFVKTIPAMLDVKHCDICYIAKTITKKGVVNESISLSGRMDEIRFWSIDMFSYFCDVNNTTNNRLNSLFNKRIMNSYIPELVAYFNAENALDTAELYSEEEHVISMSNAHPTLYFTGKQAERNLLLSGKDLILHGQYFIDNDGLYVNEAAYRKVVTLQEIIDISLSGGITKLALFNLELLVTPTQNDKLRIRLQESVITDKVSKFRTVAEYESDQLRFWQWLNIDLTHDTLFVNGVEIGKYVCSYKNQLRNAKKVQFIFGKMDLLLDQEDLTSSKNVSYEANVLLRNVALYENTSYDLNYVINRIKSGEGTSRLNQSTPAASNVEIASDAQENIVIPRIINGIPDSVLLSQYEASAYEYDIRGNLKKTPVSVTPVYLANPVIWNTALPQATWLLPKSTNDFKTVSFNATTSYVVVPVANMQDFTYFGKRVADASGVASLVIHKNGYVLLTTDLTEALDLIDQPELIANGVGNNVFSSADIIQVLHTPTTHGTSSFVKYAERSNEFIIKMFVPAGADYTTSEDAYSFIALRMDKVSSAITFYNRMIRATPGVVTKYQGLRRGDGYVSAIRDYYKNTLDHDFTVGYSGTAANTIYSEYTEYVVFTPSYNFAAKQLLVANAVLALYEQRYDDVSAQGIVKLDSLVTTENGITYTVVQDMPLPLIPVYVNSLNSIISYENLIAPVNKAYITEQFNTTQKIKDVSRSSVFAGGTFLAPVWHTGMMTGGSIKSSGFVWKHGIKYGGDISSASLYRRLSAEWFVSDQVALLYDDEATNKKRVLADKSGAQLVRNVRMDLPAGTYKMIFRVKSTVASSSTTPMAVISIFTNSVNSVAGQQVEIANRSIRPVDFTYQNKYDLIDLDLTLDYDTKGVEIGMSLINNDVVMSLDYIDIMKQSEYGKVSSPAYAHWLGGFHLSTVDSTVSDVIWYRGEWDDGIWLRGNWMSLNLDNEYQTYQENLQVVVTNDNWSVWNGGIMRSDAVVEHDSTSVYALALQPSVWHGGTWKSAVMPNQQYTYTNTDFANHVVRKGNIIQLPKVQSTWLGGQWLRGQWQGGIFANGFWHSVTTKPAALVSTYDFGADSLESVSFVNRITKIAAVGDTLYAVGYNGLISKKGDVSWNAVTTGITDNLMSLAFTPGGVGVAVGEKGVIMRSTNLETWTPIQWTFNPTELTNLYDVLFISESVGYICGDKVILKTTNSGETWQKANLSVFTLRSLAHTTGNLVYAVGDDGRIVTNNANDNWSLLSLPYSLATNFISIQFVDAQVGYILAKNGLLLKTVNGGTIWMVKTVTTPALNAVLVGAAMKFVNAYTGYVITGTNDLKMFETHDGGETWKPTSITSPIRNPTMYLNPVTEDTYIGGDNGRILFSKGAHRQNYLDAIGYQYDETASSWGSGMMLNSVWEGGVVQYSPDALNTIFGDIITQFSVVGNDITNRDFVWSKDTKLKRSDVFNGTIYTHIFGQEYFVGYHNGAETNKTKLEQSRVSSQYNEDGIMSVYWKRGKWHGGLFQFSHWSNQNLNADEVVTISRTGNFSEFEGGYFYSSYWTGGKWYNLPSTNEYAHFNDELQPNSLFYKSQWEAGYWQSGKDNIGLVTDDLNDDDMRITNGIFLKSLWSAGVWEGGLFDLSIHRSGVISKDRKIEYKGKTITLKPAAVEGDQSLAIEFDNDQNPYPNFDVIGRLTNNSDGSASTLRNASVNIDAQPTIINLKKYILNRNNTISVFNSDGTLKTNLRLDFQEIYGEIFNTTSGSNLGSNIPSNLVTALTQQGNILWVGTDNGLWKIDIISKVSIVQQAAIYVNCLFTSNSTVWVGTKTGLSAYTLETGDVVSYTTVLTGYTGDALPTNNINCIHATDSIVYVGTDNGVWSMTLPGKVAKRVNQTNYPSAGTLIPSNKVTALYSTGLSLWVGTDSGLWLLNMDVVPFIGQLFDTANTDGYASGAQLPNNYITTINNAGNIMWIGTVGGLWKIVRQ